MSDLNHHLPNLGTKWEKICKGDIKGNTRHRCICKKEKKDKIKFNPYWTFSLTFYQNINFTKYQLYQNLLYSNLLFDVPVSFGDIWKKIRVFFN